jgi:hypothetical protein
LVLADHGAIDGHGKRGHIFEISFAQPPSLLRPER